MTTTGGSCGIDNVFDERVSSCMIVAPQPNSVSFPQVTQLTGKTKGSFGPIPPP